MRFNSEFRNRRSRSNAYNDDDDGGRRGDTKREESDGINREGDEFNGAGG